MERREVAAEGRGRLTEIGHYHAGPFVGGDDRARGSSGPPAVAGYANMTVPAGFSRTASRRRVVHRRPLGRADADRPRLCLRAGDAGPRPAGVHPVDRRRVLGSAALVTREAEGVDPRPSRQREGAAAVTVPPPCRAPRPTRCSPRPHARRRGLARACPHQHDVAGLHPIAVDDAVVGGESARRVRIRREEDGDGTARQAEPHRIRRAVGDAAVHRARLGETRETGPYGGERGVLRSTCAAAARPPAITRIRAAALSRFTRIFPPSPGRSSCVVYPAGARRNP